MGVQLVVDADGDLLKTLGENAAVNSHGILDHPHWHIGHYQSFVL